VDPHLQKDIKLLEGVQKFTLRRCSKNMTRAMRIYFRVSNA